MSSSENMDKMKWTPEADATIVPFYLNSPRDLKIHDIKINYVALAEELSRAHNKVIIPRAVTHRIAAFRDLSKQKQDPAGGEGEENLPKTPTKPRTPRTLKKRGRAKKEESDESDGESPQKKPSSEFLV